MTNILEIKYSRENQITVEIDDYLYFTGANIEMKQAIINCLNRFKTGKKLSDIEENIFGDEGIQIIYNEKLLTSKNATIISINHFNSIIDELTIRRGSLLYDELLSIDGDLALNIQLEKINNELIKLESIISEKLQHLSIDAAYRFEEFLFKDLVTKNLEATYFENDVEIPVEYRNTVQLISEFVELLYNHINRTGKMIWIVLDQPFNFLTVEIFETMLECLVKISNETKLLKIFIFNSSQNISNYEIDLEKTVLLFESFLQLPSFDIFKNSIERNYPDNLTFNDKQLIKSFFRICHLIGKDIDGKYTISPKDMILLIIVKELLGDNTVIETSIANLSPIEEEFLKSKI